MDQSSNSVDFSKIDNIGAILCDANKPLKQRFRALFTLRNIGGKAAIDWISKCFTDSSDLLKHECAFCLGQMQDDLAIPTLLDLLKDNNQCAMVRHEAGEALGAIGNKQVLDILDKYSSDPSKEVAETCQLAAERIRWVEAKHNSNDETLPNPYLSVDPAPPCEDQSISSLKQILMNEKLSLFERYRAMFALRNKASSEAAVALAEGLQCKSALFRHEVAYVLGQMQDAACVDHLKENLMNCDENAMVRHECAEALGAIATEECMDILKVYATDNERVVKESCDVALDMCDYAKSDEFQYANSLVKQP